MTKETPQAKEKRIHDWATGSMQLEFDGENYFKLNPWREMRVDGKRVPNPDYGKKMIIPRDKIDADMEFAFGSFAKYGCD